MAYGKKEATFATDGFIIYKGFRIRRIAQKTGNTFEVDLGKKSGKHIRKRFSDTAGLSGIQAAKNFAEKMEVSAENEGRKAWNFTEAQRKDAVRAQGLLKGRKVTLTQAVQSYLENTRTVAYSDSTAALIDMYVEEQEARKDLRPRSLSDIKKFMAALQLGLGHMAVGAISETNVTEWLDDCDFAPTSRYNHRRYARGFFLWCADKKLIDRSPIKKCVAPQKEVPEIYTVAQTKAIMDAALSFASKEVLRWEGTERVAVYRAEIVSYLAIALFAGVRPKEIMRLRHSDLDFDAGEIIITSATSKTKKARRVTISPNLAKYLIPYRQEGDGLLFPLSETSLVRWRTKVFTLAGVTHLQDGARHSFATYFLAGHSMDDTIVQMGHTDTKVLFSNYHGLAVNRKTQAKKYFAISPDKGTLIQFKEKVA